jgi:hypothetical protein
VAYRGVSAPPQAGWEGRGGSAPGLRRKYASGWRDVLEQYLAVRARASD